MRLYKFAEKTGPHTAAVKERTSPWKLGGLTPLQLVKRVYHEINDDEVLTRSAALAYYFVSALFPMIFFLMAMLGLFAQSHDLQSSLLNYTAQFMPEDAYRLVQKTLQEIANSSTGLKLAFGLVLALWSGAGGVVSIIDALNRCYHVKDSRPFWKQRLIALGMTVAIAALTIVALTIVLYGGDIADFVGSHVGLSNVTVIAWHIVQWPIALFFVLLSFALLYFWGPDTRQQWQWITPGAVVGVLTWIGASMLFRVYLHFFNSYSKTYGSLGAVIVLLLWLYISGLAILVGGEINSEIENAAAKRGHPEAKAPGEKAA
ncbi:MAG TPA: YihY/virulence factor BrkB family protein [Candidatus Dormibacteraeota bacterium]|nr:YihY/virulence factor BrkB family protein [Candidatus Dormibacteraeota bacterium]